MAGSVALPAFAKDKHAEFIKKLDERVAKFDYWQGDYLRMNGIYWALTALLLLEPSLDATRENEAFDAASPLTRREIISFIVSCQDNVGDGGFGGNVGHDGHLTFTLSALQILSLVGALDHPEITMDRHAKWIAGLQNKDGSFSGDADGEVDTRFSYCAISSLAIIEMVHLVDVSAALEFVERCRNADGGYGTLPGRESHAGQVFCCVGMRAILGRLGRAAALPGNAPDRDATLCEWLALRQLPCGGLNGRPEKLEDVCYSWWVLSSITLLGRLHWIDSEALVRFILSCQDPVSGGISDRPDDVADVFHTLFGIAGLSLLGFEGLRPVDAATCMPLAR